MKNSQENSLCALQAQLDIELDWVMQCLGTRILNYWVLGSFIWVYHCEGIIQEDGASIKWTMCSKDGRLFFSLANLTQVRFLTFHIIPSFIGYCLRWNTKPSFWTWMVLIPLRDSHWIEVPSQTFPRTFAHFFQDCAPCEKVHQIFFAIQIIHILFLTESLRFFSAIQIIHIMFSLAFFLLSDVHSNSIYMIPNFGECHELTTLWVGIFSFSPSLQVTSHHLKVLSRHQTTYVWITSFGQESWLQWIDCARQWSLPRHAQPPRLDSFTQQHQINSWWCLYRSW